MPTFDLSLYAVTPNDCPLWAIEAALRGGRDYAAATRKKPAFRGLYNQSPRRFSALPRLPGAADY